MEQTLAVIGRLYEAVTAPAPERSWLAQIRDLIGAEHAMLSMAGDRWSWWSCDQVPDAMADTITNYASDPTYVRVAEALPPATVTRMSTLMPVAELRRTDLYHDAIRPMRGGVAAMYVWRDSGALAVANICRDADRGHDFSDPDLRLLQCVLPHLSNALHLRGSLLHARMRAAQSEAVLDTLDDGAILLQGGRVQFINRAAAKILHAAQTLRLHGQRLAALNQDDDARLQSVLRSARALANAGVRRTVSRSADPASGREPTRLSIARPTPQQPLHLLAVPASVVAGLEDSCATDTVLLWLHDPDRELTQRIAGLSTRHRLTPRETELARELAAGLSLAAAAQRLGVTTGTARQYLKSIFIKVDVHRQADLVRHLLHS